MSDKKIKTTSFDDFTDFETKLKEWILKASKPILNGTETYLLSFHDDGVVWGKVNTNGELVTSDSLNDPRFPTFREVTLQECRLFSEQGELHIWRNGNGGFKGSLFIQSENSEIESIEEKQVLWGTRTESGDDEFTIVADGSEGLRHAFPRKVIDERFKVKDDKGKVLKNEKGEDIRKRPLRLCVKHYLDYDEDGCAYTSLSRLVNVEVQ